jgi:hypothetical protein
MQCNLVGGGKLMFEAGANTWGQGADRLALLVILPQSASGGWLLVISGTF